jgi:O-antigen ligase
MVQEDVTWFSGQGAPTGLSHLIVAGTSDPNPAPFIDSPFNDVSSPPAPGRLTLWAVALQMVRDRPLLGVGPDNFRWRYGDTARLARWDTHTHANNLYIEWLADTGILGLGAFLLFSLTLIVSAWRTLRRLMQSGSPLGYWQLAALGALTTWYVHGWVDTFYELTPTTIAFWLVAGIVAVRGGDEGSVAPHRNTDQAAGTPSQS